MSSSSQLFPKQESNNTLNPERKKTPGGFAYENGILQLKIITTKTPYSELDCQNKIEVIRANLKAALADPEHPVTSLVLTMPRLIMNDEENPLANMALRGALLSTVCEYLRTEDCTITQLYLDNWKVVGKTDIKEDSLTSFPAERRAYLMRILGTALRSNNKVEVLSLAESDLSGADISNFFTNLGLKNTTLKSLILNGNPLGHTYKSEFLPKQLEHTHIGEIDIEKTNGASDNSDFEVATLIAANENIQKIAKKNVDTHHIIIPVKHWHIATKSTSDNHTKQLPFNKNFKNDQEESEKTNLKSAPAVKTDERFAAASKIPNNERESFQHEKPKKKKDKSKGKDKDKDTQAEKNTDKKDEITSSVPSIVKEIPISKYPLIPPHLTPASSPILAPLIPSYPYGKIILACGLGSIGLGGGIAIATVFTIGVALTATGIGAIIGGTILGVLAICLTVFAIYKINKQYQNDVKNQIDLANHINNKVPSPAIAQKNENNLSSSASTKEKLTSSSTPESRAEINEAGVNNEVFHSFSTPELSRLIKTPQPDSKFKRHNTDSREHQESSSEVVVQKMRRKK